MGTQISKAGAQAAQAAALKEQMAQRAESMKEATQRSNARLKARDKRIAAMGQRLRTEGLNAQKQSEKAQKADDAALYAEAQMRQDAYRKAQQRAAEFAAGVGDKFGSEATANQDNVSNKIADFYESANREAERLAASGDGEGAADEVLRMYGEDDPLQVIQAFNAERDRLQEERAFAIKRQKATTENAKNERVKQNQQYQAEVKAVEQERLLAEGQRLDEASEKTAARAQVFRALRQQAQDRNNEFADRRAATITANEKASDFKRLQIFEQRRSEMQAATKRDAQITEEALKATSTAETFERAQFAREQTIKQAKAASKAEMDEALQTTDTTPTATMEDRKMTAAADARQTAIDNAAELRSAESRDDSRSMERRSVNEELNAERALNAANIQRTKALAKQAELRGDEASKTSQEVAKAKLKPAREKAAVVLDDRMARNAAEDAARYTVENPAEAVAAQPYLSVQAVLRVLS